MYLCISIYISSVRLIYVSRWGYLCTVSRRAYLQCTYETWHHYAEECRLKIGVKWTWHVTPCILSLWCNFWPSFKLYIFCFFFTVNSSTALYSSYVSDCSKSVHLMLLWHRILTGKPSSEPQLLNAVNIPFNWIETSLFTYYIFFLWIDCMLLIITKSCLFVFPSSLLFCFFAMLWSRHFVWAFSALVSGVVL